jgi:tetratricopeptide (TPR) repeat protein
MLERSGKLSSNPIVLLRQAQACQLMGDYEKAREILEPLVQRNPDNLEAQERLAEVALQQKDATTALRCLQHLLQRGSLTSRAAYLFRRAHTLCGNETQADEWQAKEVSLRRKERQLATLQSQLQADPQSPRARLIASYQSATFGDWESAAQNLAALLRQSPEYYAESFVQQLAEAIRQRGPLPPIESLMDFKPPVTSPTDNSHQSPQF